MAETIPERRAMERAPLEGVLGVQQQTAFLKTHTRRVTIASSCAATNLLLARFVDLRDKQELRDLPFTTPLVALQENPLV